jgi:hypothetical protein
MTSLGVPEGRKRPIEGRGANLRKIDNFLPSRLDLILFFRNLDWSFGIKGKERLKVA